MVLKSYIVWSLPQALYHILLARLTGRYLCGASSLWLGWCLPFSFNSMDHSQDNNIYMWPKLDNKTKKKITRFCFKLYASFTKKWVYIIWDFWWLAWKDTIWDLSNSIHCVLYALSILMMSLLIDFIIYFIHYHVVSVRWWVLILSRNNKIKALLVSVTAFIS